MTTMIDELSREQEEMLTELVERVIENGKLELEFGFEILGINFHFQMPDQGPTENAMDESGRDRRGRIRDGLTRDIMYQRIILSKSIMRIDEVEMNESMSRGFLSRVQPEVVQALFARYMAQREAFSILVSRAIDVIKKSQPDLSTE